MQWIKLDNWKDLPEGTWLTKSKDRVNPYNIAEVTCKTGDGHKMIIVGNRFSFDTADPTAYTEFEFYEEDEQ